MPIYADLWPSGCPYARSARDPTGSCERAQGEVGGLANKVLGGLATNDQRQISGSTASAPSSFPKSPWNCPDCGDHIERRWVRPGGTIAG